MKSQGLGMTLLENNYSSPRLREIVRDTSLTSRPSKGTAIFTICANNYVSMASILLNSAKEFHPDATTYLCLADALLPDIDFYPKGSVVAPIEDLDIPDFRSFVFRYDIMEVNTAVKPFMIQYPFRLGHQV